MSGPRLAAVVSAGLVASCNLVVSLDDLQDGAGGASSGTQSIATATNATSTASVTATVASTTAAATGGGGSGGEGPSYDDCVASLGPVVRLKLDGAAGDSETNLGAWGGSAAYSGGRNAEAPLTAGSLAAASFAPDGVLDLPAQGGFFGGSPSLPVFIQGELVWQGGVEFQRSNWNNVPIEQAPGERRAAYIFQRNAQNNWSEIAKLSGNDAQSGESYAAAVAISNDIALVSAPTQNKQTGAVYVFRRNGNSWTPSGAPTRQSWHRSATAA